MKNFFSLFGKAFNGWLDNNASSLSAALAYYTIFSLAPLLVIIIGIAGLVLSQPQAEKQIFTEINSIVGHQSADFVRDIAHNSGPQNSHIIAVIFGAIVLLFGATGVFGQLQYSLDIIWKTPARKKRGFIKTIRNQLLAFAVVLLFGLLLLLSLLASIALSALSRSLYIESQLLLQILNFIISYVSAAVLFALMYRFLPNTRIPWHDCWVGALFTALLFIIGRLLIGLFLGSGAITSKYGPAASFIILLLWIYYSAQIFYYGAEFTYAYSQRPDGLIKRLKNL